MGAMTIRSARAGRTATMGVALAAAVAAGPAVAVVVQEVKYSAPINVTTGRVTLQASATFSDGSSADRLYRVKGDADSDGDGVPDEIWLRVACSGGAATGAQAYSLRGHTPVRPRVENQVKRQSSDAGRLATGKRQHKPFKIIRELEFAAAIGKIVSWEWDFHRATKPPAANWDIKSNSGKSAGKATPTFWHHVKLNPGATELCN